MDGPEETTEGMGERQDAFEVQEAAEVPIRREPEVAAGPDPVLGRPVKRDSEDPPVREAQPQPPPQAPVTTRVPLPRRWHDVWFEMNRRTPYSWREEAQWMLNGLGFFLTPERRRQLTDVATNPDLGEHNLTLLLRDEVGHYVWRLADQVEQLSAQLIYDPARPRLPYDPLWCTLSAMPGSDLALAHAENWRRSLQQTAVRAGGRDMTRWLSERFGILLSERLTNLLRQAGTPEGTQPDTWESIARGYTRLQFPGGRRAGRPTGGPATAVTHRQVSNLHLCASPRAWRVMNTIILERSRGLGLHTDDLTEEAIMMLHDRGDTMMFNDQEHPQAAWFAYADARFTSKTEMSWTIEDNSHEKCVDTIVNAVLAYQAVAQRVLLQEMRETMSPLQVMMHLGVIYVDFAMDGVYEELQATVDAPQMVQTRVARRDR